MQRPSNTPDIDQMIATLPRNEQVLVKMLRALVIECIPQATEKIYYDMVMPFYTRNRMICFIWPPSVTIGTKPALPVEEGSVTKKTKGVALGFSQGNLMSNEDGVLLAEGRKQVYMMYFKKPADIDESQVRALLFEAAMIDEGFIKKRKNASRKVR